VLAVSDEIDPALEFLEVRRSLGPIDLVVGCGDLDPGYLAMLGDAFMAPLLFVHGNHDRGLGWTEHRHLLPEAMADGKPVRVGDIRLRASTGRALARAALIETTWGRGCRSCD